MYKVVFVSQTTPRWLRILFCSLDKSHISLDVAMVDWDCD